MNCEEDASIRPPSVTSSIQVLLESIWKSLFESDRSFIVQSNDSIERSYNAVVAELPEIITNQHLSLLNVSVEVLEKSSLGDMLICQLMMQIVEMWNGEVPDPLAVIKKRRNRNSLEDPNFAVPIVFSSLSSSFIVFQSQTVIM